MRSVAALLLVCSSAASADVAPGVREAIELHKQAQSLKKLALAESPPVAARLAAASDRYRLAAAAYRSYLPVNSRDPALCHYYFFLGEALYYSQPLGEAAVEYERVRDWPGDGCYREDAALNASKAREKLLEQRIATGLILPPLPDRNSWKSKPNPLPLPDDLTRLVDAYDRLVELVPARASKARWAAAQIDLRFGRWDRARARLMRIVDEDCPADEAKQAAETIMATYVADGNSEQVIAWTDRRCACAAKAAPTSTTIWCPGDSRFWRAQTLMNRGDYVAAAEGYLRIVDGNPANRGGDNDKALNNAAVAWEKAGRYEDAIRAYGRVVDLGGDFANDALFRTGVNQQKMGDFGAAIGSYLRIVDDPRFRRYPHRADAMWNAADLLEQDHQPRRAASLFERYARDPSVKRAERDEARARARSLSR